MSIVEKLSRYHNVKLEFLTPEEAKGLIELNSQYFQHMNKPNLQARGCQTVDELYNKCLDAFDTITSSEQDTVTKFFYNLLEQLKSRNQSYYRYITKWLNTISFAKAKPWLEDGMPHTLKQTVIMDADWFKNPRESTFVHELAHVHQRAHPFEFEDLYSELGYIYYAEDIKGLEYVYELNRNNPDGISKNWIWHDKITGNHWWIGAIFNNVLPSSLTDVKLVGLKLETSPDGTFYYLKQEPTPLAKVPNFDKIFGANPNNYHPNEMSAKFSEWFLDDVMNKGNQYYNYGGFIVYKKYFQKLLDNYY
jgi:hypothetical protein